MWTRLMWKANKAFLVRIVIVEKKIKTKNKKNKNKKNEEFYTASIVIDNNNRFIKIKNQIYL